MKENKNTEPDQPPEKNPEVDQSNLPAAEEKIISSEETILPESNDHQLSTLNTKH